MVTELNTWDSFSPGHLDQHLYPFYRRALDSGSLTREQARELLGCFWVKFNNQPAPPKVGVTAAESGTYTDFCNINTGGLKSGRLFGASTTSPTWCSTSSTRCACCSPPPTCNSASKNPDRFLKRGLEIVRKGWGQPSIFNADMIVEELLRQGKSIEDARAGGISGCVETGAFGKEAYILTGYFNLPKVLEITLNNGVDPRTGKNIGLATGDPRDVLRATSSSSRPSAASCATSSRSRSAATTSSNGSTPPHARAVPLAPGRRLHRQRRATTTTAARATTPPTSWRSRPAPAPTAWPPSATTSSTARPSPCAELLAALDANFDGHEKTRLTLWNKIAQIRQ